MGKSLVIVESPAKAKTINKYLGDIHREVECRSYPRSTHLRQWHGNSDPKERAAQAARTRKMAPRRKRYTRKSAKEQLVRRMGIDPENGWNANYEILPGKEKVVRS